MTFSRLSPQEMERRRTASVEALRVREREEFDKWYQEVCDREYWSAGQCCYGCDYWQSDMGGLGYCAAAGVVSGDQVMASMGISFCSHTPSPGLPLTRGDFWCGKFRDDFDWTALPGEYLDKIGALFKGVMQEKPNKRRERSGG